MKWMMILLVLSADICHGQTRDEWTRQKKTQKKYLLEQILAFKQYGSYLVKGYSITKGGLNVIAGLKQGCYSQDNEFFKSMKIVSPRVKQYKRIAEIITKQVRTLKAMQEMIAYCGSSQQLAASERVYITEVFDRVIDECAADMDRLMKVITDSKLEMSDDERIQEIDELYALTLDKQSFVQSFDNGVKTLVVQRTSEMNEVKRSKLLNGIK